jgi:hypothetical protein
VKHSTTSSEQVSDTLDAATIAEAQFTDQMVAARLPSDDESDAIWRKIKEGEAKGKP